jgi:hypothetical protein
MSVSIESMVERWSGLDRPLFKGRLIDGDGCKCAQGDVLSCAGFTDDQLRSMTQDKADGEVAAILGISRTHAVLLRNVNDKVGGAPQLVLSDPAQVVGSKAPYLLAFWLHLDGLSDAAWAAAWDATWNAAWVTSGTSSEIQGMDKLEADGRKPYFLAFFGFTTWDAVRALVK